MQEELWTLAARDPGVQLGETRQIQLGTAKALPSTESRGTGSGLSNLYKIRMEVWVTHTLAATGDRVMEVQSRSCPYSDDHHLSRAARGGDLHP